MMNVKLRFKLRMAADWFFHESLLSGEDLGVGKRGLWFVAEPQIR